MARIAEIITKLGDSLEIPPNQALSLAGRLAPSILMADLSDDFQGNLVFQRRWSAIVNFAAGAAPSTIQAICPDGWLVEITHFRAFARTAAYVLQGVSSGTSAAITTPLATAAFAQPLDWRDVGSGNAATNVSVEQIASAIATPSLLDIGPLNTPSDVRIDTILTPGVGFRLESIGNVELRGTLYGRERIRIPRT